jgi:hypothetical protein
MAKTMVERAVFLEDVRHRLEQAQVVQKRFYDNNHQAVAYEVGDWVLLRLHNRPVASMSLASKGSCSLGSLGPTASPRSSMTLRSGLPFHHMPRFMMCSMWAS